MSVAAEMIANSTLSQKLCPSGGAIVGLVGPGAMETFALGTGVAVDTPMEAGSLTKIFTGLLTAQAVLRNELQLSTRLDEFLFQEQWPGNAISVEHLATHTSGLPRISITPTSIALHLRDPYRAYRHNDLLDYLRNHKPATAGSTVAYSNFGYAVLGAMLERAAGRTYEDLLQMHVLDPLHLASTGLHLTGRPDLAGAGQRADGSSTSVWHFDAYAPCGALVTTLNDLASAAQVFLDPTNPVAEALTLALEPRAELPGNSVGLAWMTPKGANWSWHNGATFGYSSYLGIDRARCTAAIILANQCLATEVTGLGHDLMRRGI